MKSQFIRNHVLAKNIGLLDGQSGSGKSLIGPIISSLSNCEYWLHDHIIEEIIVFLKYKKISLDAARAMLGIQVDLNLYNLLIGRNVNFRNYDTSSVIYGGLDKIYSKRLKLKDGDQISRKIQINNPFLLFNTHHLLMSYKLIQKLFFKRNLIFISVSRDPITIINNFYKNNWEEKYLNNPRELTLTTTKNQKTINAWYLDRYEDKKISFIEKYASFVIDYQKFQYRFHHKNHILVKFEEFIQNPIKYIQIFEKKFGKKTKITNQLLKKFDLPRKNAQQNKERDIEETYKFITNTKLKNKIYKASKDYNN